MGRRSVTVAFDWNGTLVDDVNRAYFATRQVLKQHAGKDLSLAAFRRSYHLPLSSFLYGLGITRTDLPAAEDDLDRLVGQMPTHTSHAAIQTLRDLRDSGVRTGVVSAAGASVATDIAELDMQALFDFVQTGVTRKREALQELAVGTSLIYVGDTEYDVQEARAAGATAIAYARGYRPRSALRRAAPDAIVDELPALRSVVRRLDR